MQEKGKAKIIYWHSSVSIKVEWDFGYFRDCNGISNGIDLHPDTIAAEEEAGIEPEGTPAGFLGPVIRLRL